MDLLKSSNSQLCNNGSTDAIIHCQFNDIDELAVFLPENIRLTLLECAPFSCRSMALDLGTIQFNFSYVSRSLHAVGAKHEGFLTFAMILEGQGQHGIESHRLVTEDYLFGFDCDREANLIFPGNATYCAVYIRPDVFEACSQAMDRPELNSSFFAANYAYLPASFPPLRGYLRQLHKLLDQNAPSLQNPGFQKIILQDFLPLLVTALPAQSEKKAAKSFRRSQLVKQADDYMRAHLDQVLTLTDLCQALGTSSRALCYGFQEMFGKSPMSYLKTLRLQGVYRALKAAEPDHKTVTETATQFGFYHLGYFAQDYRQMFGERPSETLKRYSGSQCSHIE